MLLESGSEFFKTGALGGLRTSLLLINKMRIFFGFFVWVNLDISNHWGTTCTKTSHRIDEFYPISPQQHNSFHYYVPGLHVVSFVFNTLPKFNSLPLKSYLPKRKVVSQPSFFRGYVKLRAGKHLIPSDDLRVINYWDCSTAQIWWKISGNLSCRGETYYTQSAV